MSNFLAIATVTATIKQLLLDNVGNDVPGITVSSNPPDIFQGKTVGNQINLFLYQIQLNPNYRNEDVPQRDSDGNIIKLPRMGLNLNYLITAYGEGNDDLLAQQIMASAIRTLNDNPVLTGQMIANAISGNPSINQSDLASQIERVRITPHPLSFEEITKLWSIFFQTSYRLSFAYQATVILLEGLVNVVPTLPVSKDGVNVFVYSFSQPYIQAIDSQIIEMDPAATITIKGKNLANSNVSVMFGDIEQPVTNAIVNDQITVQLPDVPAGIVSVTVRHQAPIGSQPTPNRVYEESNAFPIMVQPKITNSSYQSATRQITVGFIPALRTDQRMEILIGNHTLQVPMQSAQTNSILVNIPDSIATGTYLLRIRINNVESKLTQQTTPGPDYNKYNGPQIAIT